MSGTRQVRFTAPDEFEIGDLKFGLASAQKATTSERILLYKGRPFVDSYIETLPPLAPARALEFGIYQGGSALFLTALLDLRKYVCIDIMNPLKTFDAILAAHSIGKRIRPYYNTSQGDADRVRQILQREFGDEPIDMIIDDASHEYALTKKSFEITFPYLADGGHYIIEDWSWAHWPDNQKESHGRFGMPAMSNLILELVLLLPSSDLIESITVRHGYVVIKKKSSRFRNNLLNIDATLRLRGRPMIKI